ncbi:GmrSD restriction endonuclease domain-containing protein [Brevibacillus sp. SYSU BS000544]|uniref:GmrSD restriction endonuclease domain-containing protein n=1 Tax=Brevibacillus sp. SYSU BS000544 TaxID=3416443 RepID=UPI003CE4F44B
MKNLRAEQSLSRNLLTYQYGQKHTFSVLALLYPTLDFRDKFHLDHIFAKSLFTKKNLSKIGVPEDKQDAFINECNVIVNLQLLEGVPNQQKSNMNFNEWIVKTYPDLSKSKDYMEKHYIPNIDLKLTNSDNFIEQRRQLFISQLTSILTV